MGTTPLPQKEAPAPCTSLDSKTVNSWCFSVYTGRVRMTSQSCQQRLNIMAEGQLRQGQHLPAHPGLRLTLGSGCYMRERGRMGISGHVSALERQDSLGVTFGESQLEHGNSDDSRKKCQAALLGCLCFPQGSTQVRALHYPASHHQWAGCPFQISPGMLTAAICVASQSHRTHPRGGGRGDSTLVSENQGMSQSSWYFAPVA